MNIKIQKQDEIIEHYGMTSQLGIATEECAELIQAISKMSRAKDMGKYTEARSHLIEEIADVIVCIDQLKIMFNIGDSQISEMVNFKIHRQIERMKGEGE